MHLNMSILAVEGNLIQLLARVDKGFTVSGLGFRALSNGLVGHTARNPKIQSSNLDRRKMPYNAWLQRRTDV